MSVLNTIGISPSTGIGGTDSSPGTLDNSFARTDEIARIEEKNKDLMDNNKRLS
jgi:hypothetical protein